NFGVAVGAMPLVRADGTPSPIVRVFATIRGDPSLTWVDYDSQARTMNCGADGSFPRCAKSHRLDQYENDPDLGMLASEPFHLSIDPLDGYVFLTHLTSSAVTLARAPVNENEEPVLLDLAGPLFSLGLRRAFGVAVRQPGDTGGPVYVTSSSETGISTVHVVPGPIGPSGSGSGGSADGILAAGQTVTPSGVPAFGDRRGITFSADGNRAFIVNRIPPQVLVYDTTLGVSGLPRNQLLAGIEICAEASLLATASLGTEADEDTENRVFVPCFKNGQLWTVDVERYRVVSIADVGRGPIGVAVSPSRGKVFVSNFAEDTIAVVDARPGGQNEGQTVIRLGTPRHRD
ncbi:MAG: hypothetical protein V2A73_12830, partial [Pseudomonadota bacterium]